MALLSHITAKRRPKTGADNPHDHEDSPQEWYELIQNPHDREDYLELYIKAQSNKITKTTPKK